MAEYLISHLDEIIFLIKAFETKLLSQIILFPLNLYKIYIYFKDENNKHNFNKYEKYFHFYMKFIFQEIRNLLEPDIYSEIVKALCEYQILIKNNDSDCFLSTEIIEIISKFCAKENKIMDIL